MNQSLLRRFLLLLGLAALVTATRAQDIQVVSYTNTQWIYNDTSQLWNNPGTAWKEPGFVPVIGTGENEWKAGGRGLFGNDGNGVYNAADDPFRGGLNGFATPLNRLTNASTAGRITFYFITKFNWPFPAEGVVLRGTNFLDDGAIVYLNGVEVFRARVPGTVGTPPAWENLGENPPTEGVPEALEYSAISLVTGENTLAVELHQSSAGSSDVAFATALRAVVPQPPFISTPDEPADRVVLQNRSTTLAIEGDGQPRPTMQWFKNDVAIPDATNKTYNIPLMSEGDAGSYFVRLVNEFGTTNSRIAVIGYEADLVAPTLVRAVGSASFTNIVIEFNEVMDPITSTDSFLYEIVDSNGNALGVTSASLAANGKTVILETDLQAENTLYTVTLQPGMLDLALNPFTAEAVTVDVRSWVSVTDCSGLLYEQFNGNVGGNAIATLLANPKYPNSPDIVSTLSTFATTPDVAENYGGRVRGLFFPNVSGDWTFYLSSDDSSQLFLNPSGPDASGKVLVTEELGCCGAYTAHATAAYPLIAGQGYYIEGLFQEGGGGDFIRVAATLAGTPAPVGNAIADAIPGNLLGATAAPAGAAGAINITSEPADVTVFANSLVNFSVSAANVNGLPLCYQWQRNGIDILGANKSSYGFGPVSVEADDTNTFQCKISVLGSTIMTRPAVLTVNADIIPPSCLSASASFSLSNIVVRFSEFVEMSTAEDSFNYSVSDGFAVDTARLNPDGMSVSLNLSGSLAPGSTYSVTVQNVADLAGNVIDPNPCTLTFRAPVISCGFLLFQAYDTSSTAGTDVNLLLNHPNYPNNPRDTAYIGSFDSRAVYPDDSHEQFGAQVSGYFIPPTSGNWIFYLRSDDASRLVMNPIGTDPAGAILLTEELACCTTFADHASAPQALVAGEKYYISAIYKEGGGGDFVQVAAKLETDPTPPNSLSPISGAYLASLADPTGAILNLTQNPVDQSFVISADTLLVEDFNAGDGGFTVETPDGAFNTPWAYSGGSWQVVQDAAEVSHPMTTLLTSPELTVTKPGPLAITLNHRWSVEGPDWDGCQLQISINGGAFVAVNNFTQNGYNGLVGGGSASILKGQQAWVVDSPNFNAGTVTSIGITPAVATGDRVRIRLTYAGDTNTRGSSTPSWQVDEIKVVQAGAGVTTVTFSAAAVGSLPGNNNPATFYQWYCDNGSGFVPVAGANSPNLTFTPVLAQNGNRYRAAIYIPGATVTSDSALLTVLQPNTPPTFACGPDQNVNEDAVPQVRANWATGITPHTPFVVPVERANVLTPGDPLVIVNGVDDGDGAAGAPPAGEVESHAIDGITQKYLNFLDLGSGFSTTPSKGITVVTGVRFYTANDAEERDPASYILEGSLTGTDGPWTVISSGPLALPSTRNVGGAVSINPATHAHQLVDFPNGAGYTSYRVTFPTLKNAGSANSMQIAEVELLGIPFTPGDPGAEAGQNVHFLLSNNNESLFSAQPAISADGTLTYTPAPNACGSATVTVVAKDDGGTADGGNDTSLPCSFTINVACVNDCPVAGNQSVGVNEDSSVAIVLTGSDVEGDALSYGYSQPAHGTVTGTAPNVAYTPAANYCGPDSFTFTVNDGQCTSAAATVTINVVCVPDDNICPVAVAKVSPLYSHPSLTKLTVLSINGTNGYAVLDGSLSSDADGDALTYVWLIDGSPVPVATGVLATNAFELGDHQVLLAVDDGTCIGMDTVEIEVISATEAVELLIGDVNATGLSLRVQRSLNSHLKTTQLAVEHCDVPLAIAQLNAFKSKLNVLIRVQQAALRNELARKTQALIDAINAAAALQADCNPE